MEKQTYLVAEGVAWVNGARVPDSREVTLSEQEARFDLDQGRIAPIAEVSAEVSGDGTGTALPPIDDPGAELNASGTGGPMVGVEAKAPAAARKAKG